MKKKKLIIDTDIGNDIDDAFVVCAAMKNDLVDVLAFTTVYGATDKRAKMVKALLLSNNNSIPVYAGCKYPLETRTRYGKNIDFDEAPSQYSNEYENIKYDGDDAVSEIINILEKSNEKISILAIGALTNIATVLIKRPDLKEKIETLYVMGGGFERNIEEFNYACDPKAASIVLNSILDLKLIGLDVTFQCKLPKRCEKQIAKSKNKTLNILWKMKAAWTQDIHLHDILAYMCTYTDKYVTYEKRNVDVDYESSVSSGRVVNYQDFNWFKKPLENQSVAMKVKSKLVIKDCMKMLLKYNVKG